MDRENLRVLFAKFCFGLFVERAERVYGLLLCGCEARLLLLWGACLPDDSFLRAEKDDFPRGKTLLDGKSGEYLHGGVLRRFRGIAPAIPQTPCPRPGRRW